MEYNILVVDDEESITNLLELYLKNENYNVYKFYTGQDALDALGKINFDLAILDIMLPDIDGFTICKKIRNEYFFPILILTAKIDALDKINGLALGADDYLTKPFNPLELVARVKSQLRRYTLYNQVNYNKTTFEHDFRGLIINNTKHTCILYGQYIPLTPIEFSILWYLCENKGNVISTEELFEKVWGYKYLDNNNTVMAHIARIREKMNEPARKPKFIRTVWGVGYTID